MFKRILIFLFLILPTSLNAQVVKSAFEPGYIVPGAIIDGDTVIHVFLQSISVFPPRKFRNEKDKMRYTKLVMNVKKVYPYSQVVKSKLYEINSEMSNLNTNRARKDFIKNKEDELRKQFEGELRKFTYSQGRILIKLIDRETGQTTYDVVKQLKGTLSAVFWQSVAVIFQSSLKYEYNAVGDDRMIEEIVILIENGMI